MHEQLLLAASKLSTDALFAHIQTLALRERDATVELVAHLAELIGRKTDLGAGWGPVYEHLRAHLHLSEDAAYNRVAAARAVRRFPVILDHLAAGRVNVATVKVLAPVLTDENHVGLLKEARHRRKAEVEIIVARVAPRAETPGTIRRLPARELLTPVPDAAPNEGTRQTISGHGEEVFGPRNTSAARGGKPAVSGQVAPFQNGGARPAPKTA